MNIVYADPEVYAAWPANHGAWQWGKEWLIGFLRGQYARKSMHNIREPYEYCFARSVDDGATWTIEPHGQEFSAGVVVHHAPPFDMASTIRRVCGVYDHGGDDTDPRGGFFLSNNHGRDWHGPYLFDGLEEQFNGEEDHCTGRQAELGDLLFLSNAQRHYWGTDRIFAARHDGERFRFVSYVNDGTGRAVMPAVARLGERIVVAARRRSSEVRHGWIDAYHSDDNGETWSVAAQVGITGSNNGNPPALIESGGRLCCVYGNRTRGVMLARWSADGVVWGPEIVIAQGVRGGNGFDMGYPRTLKRDDGTVVAIFYVATEERPQQHIASVDVHAA